MMRTTTHLTLLEFVNMLGLNPYRFFQITDTPSNGTIISGPALQYSNGCECILDYDVSGMSRSAFLNAIALAESIFEQWTGASPTPIQIRNDRYAFEPRIKILKTPIQAIGVEVLSFLENMALPITAPIDYENVVITFGVPLGTQPDDIRLFFTESDAGEPVDPACRDWQVRPIRSYVNGTTATVYIPIWLLVKPELYRDTSSCLANAPSTYVDSVDVYIASIDKCQQGNYIFPPQGDCGGVPCEETKSPACFWNTQGDWYAHSSATCEDGVFKKLDYCKGKPYAIEVNYLSGFPLKGGMVDPIVARVIFLLAVGNATFTLDDCCEPGARAQWNRLRTVPRVSTGEASRASHMILVPENVMETIGYLSPNTANLQAWGLAQQFISRVSADVLI